MKNINWRTFLTALLWSEFFIALPAWLGHVAFHTMISNPPYHSFCQQFGFWGIVLGMNLLRIPFMMLGALIGYCAGMYIGCRLYGKVQFSSWILNGKDIWLLSTFTRRLLKLFSN
jgi:hypothetical protein